MLYSLRRFRRSLLLPPGWVALGALLPLSCWLLGRQLKPGENVVQLTVPPFRPDSSFLKLYQYGSLTEQPDEYSPYTDIGSPQAAAKLARMRPWRHFNLSGQTSLDSVQLLRIEAAVKAIQTDTGHAGGVQVRFGRPVAYQELVSLLDIMSCLGQKRYWLDIIHKPTTLYAITQRPPTLAERRGALVLDKLDWGPIGCLGLSRPAASPLANLREPERRPQVLLTGAVAALLVTALTGTLVLAPGTWRGQN